MVMLRILHLELGYISVTTILAATIGMVDKPAGGLVINRIQCHSKGLERVYGLQGGTESPTDDLV